VKLFSKISNLCDHNSPTLQRDGQTTCDRTKVHRAVKSDLDMPDNLILLSDSTAVKWLTSETVSL